MIPDLFDRVCDFIETLFTIVGAGVILALCIIFFC